MKFKAVGFDYAGVIAGPPGNVFAEDASKLFGISITAFEEAYFKYNKDWNKGDISDEQFCKKVAHELGQNEKFDLFLSFVKERREKKINPNIVSLVEKLRSLGYKTGLLSNNFVEVADELRSKGFDKHFDAFHISEETGYTKPDFEAYDFFIKALDILPSELIFVDDAQNNLEPAQEIGFHPILYSNYDSLIINLKTLRILK